MYEVLCQIHEEITQHGGQKQTWKSIIDKWGWIKQDIMENFVNNCTIYAVQKPSFHPLIAKPIIAKNFLSHVQVNISLYYRILIHSQQYYFLFIIKIIFFLFGCW